VFSPSHHSTADPSSVPSVQQDQPFEHYKEDQKLSPTNSAVSTMTSQSQNMTAASSLVEASLSEHHDQFASDLKSLRQGMDQLLATREQAAAAVAAAVEEERRRADQFALEAQVVRSESLASTNLRLEETNKTLQKRLQELQRDTVQAKELLVIERTRLNGELQATQRESSVRIHGLEESRQQLEAQVAILQQQKTTLDRQVSDLETEVKVANEKLDHATTLFETTSSVSVSEKESLRQEVQRLNELNAQLTTDLHAATEAQDGLESKLSEYEDDLDRLQNLLLPESEEQLQEALAKLQAQTQATERAEAQLHAYQSKIKQLQHEAVTLREGMEQERVNFQQLNEDSSVAFEKMKKQAAVKDEKNQELMGQLESLQNDLERERTVSQQCNDEFIRWKQEMERRTSELDLALAETMSLLEVVEGKEKEASSKLEGALSRLELEVQAKEHALIDSQNNEVGLKRLEEACLRLETEAREHKRRAKELEHQLQAAVTERDFARERVEHHDMREEELFRKLMENERVRRDLHNRVMQLSGNIRVFVRVRPLLANELDEQQQSLNNQAKERRSIGNAARKSLAATTTSYIQQDDERVNPFHFPSIYDRSDDSKASSSSMSSVACHGTDDVLKNLIEVTEPYKDRGGLSDRRKKWRFGFDQVFVPQQGQEDVWKATEPLVQSSIDGYNVTVFAFGQTGSGKTFTLLGEPGNDGLIARSVAKLFEAKQEIIELSRGETRVDISVELLEIYNEQVRDLLAPSGGANGLEVALKVTSNEVIGNERLPVASEGQVAQILSMAQKRRCVKATLSNAESSRSHMIFTVHFHVTNNEGMQRLGKLNICDLAGSERLSKSGANTFVGVSTVQ
jgi:kinesin family protein C1